MTEMTEAERREMNRRLARAMGIPDEHWTFQCLKEDHLLDGHGPHAFCLTCVAPVSKSALVPPDFTRDLAASRELVEWVAAQGKTIQCDVGAQILTTLFPAEMKSDSNLPLPLYELIFALLTASPLLIAIAADAATRGKDER